MPHTITVKFLGTTSGGGPTETRNCSSLVVDATGNSTLWMVDCAEGTYRQFIQQPPPRPGNPRARVSQVSKIFITHMHADHTMGILTFLRNALGMSSPDPLAQRPNHKPAQIEIFGPHGIRRMLRTLWNTTHTRSENSYVVHELLFQGEHPSVPADVQVDGIAADVRSDSECVGRDIWCDEQGFWRNIVDVRRQRQGIVVDAGPIQHRDSCIGYIIREIPQMPFQPQSSPMPRKLVILGDTCDPSQLVPLIHADPPFASVLPAQADPCGTGDLVRIPVSLLVHEATDACIPSSLDPQGRVGKNRTKESVKAKAVERGHSTPGMAGAFARKIAAERLVLNHIGARFQAAGKNSRSGDPQANFRRGCMREIERQAAETWGNKITSPHAAWDYFSVDIPPNLVPQPGVPQAPGVGSSMSIATAAQVVAADVSMEAGVGVQSHAVRFGGGTEGAGPSSSAAVERDNQTTRRRGRNRRHDNAATAGIEGQRARESECGPVRSESRDNGQSQSHKGKRKRRVESEGRPGDDQEAH